MMQNKTVNGVVALDTIQGVEFREDSTAQIINDGVFRELKPVRNSGAW